MLAIFKTHCYHEKRKLDSLKLRFKKFCHINAVDAREILVTYLNLACKNTRETQISFHVTKIVFADVKTEEQLEMGM